MTSVSPLGKQEARAAATAIGGTPSVVRYYDEDESHHIDIMRCSGAPHSGWDTYSTLGLSDYQNLLDGRHVPVELAAVGRARDEALANALATAAFNVLKEGWLAAPGVVFPNLMADYGLSASLPHVVWMPPTPWPPLAALPVGDGIVHWLLAVPLAETEVAVLHSRGYEYFESTIADDVAYYDLERTPRHGGRG